MIIWFWQWVVKQLVGGALDIQLRQLRENGLDGLAIYKEIRTMRENLDQIADKEMQQIVDLLDAALQAKTDDEKLNLFHEARDNVRTVVVKLMAERQKLLRRLQIARIAAQVRQLIDRETKAQNATESLGNLPEQQQDQATLSTLQDQRK